MKSFYRKVQYIAIPLFAMFAAFFFSVNQVSAAWSAGLTFSVNGANFTAYVYSPPNAISEVSGSETLHDVGTKMVATVSSNLTFHLTESYSTALYLNGLCRFNVNLPLTLPAGASFYPNASASFEFSEASGFYPVVRSFAVISSNVSLSIDCFFDNYYLTGGNTTNTFANVNIPFTFKYFLPIDFVTNTEIVNFGTPTVSSGGINLNTSVLPSTTSGLAGQISQSVLFGLQQYGINDNLSGIASLLSTIYQNNSSMYNQIVSQLVAGVQNDNRLMSALQSLITDYMVYDNKDLAEMLYRYVYVLFPSFMEAGQSEADEANANATSMASNMDDVAASLEVARPDISNDFAIANNAITPDVVSGQGDLFFWLRGETLLVTIVVISVSIGLMGFILYGKGGA